MKSNNRKLEQTWSGVGWGLFLILVGALVFADGRGWLTGGEGWLYFIIGTGAIFIIGFLARFFGNPLDRWGAFGSLIAGVSLVYAGAAFLAGFGDWWPLALVFAGAAYLAREIWSRKQDATQGIDVA